MKLRQYLTVFPSHFNNIFLKSFRLLQNLMRNGMILQQLMRFHKTNDISWNFSGITLGFHEVLNYFLDIWFCFRYFQKMTSKLQFLLNWFKISKFRTFQWQKLIKVNIADTYRENDNSMNISGQSQCKVGHYKMSDKHLSEWATLSFSNCPIWRHDIQ